MLAEDVARLKTLVERRHSDNVSLAVARQSYVAPAIGNNRPMAFVALQFL